jgi:hypothetical protein
MIRFLAIGLFLAAGMTAATAQISLQYPRVQQPAPPPPPVIVPGAVQPPASKSFGDKVVRCMHYGSTQGVRPGDIPQYTRECVNAQ